MSVHTYDRRTARPRLVAPDALALAGEQDAPRDRRSAGEPPSARLTPAISARADRRAATTAVVRPDLTPAAGPDPTTGSMTDTTTAGATDPCTATDPGADTDTDDTTTPGAPARSSIRSA